MEFFLESYQEDPANFRKILQIPGRSRKFQEENFLK
jgi:hypothetical protein